MIERTCATVRRLLWVLTSLSIALAQESRQPVFRTETGLVQVYASILDQSGQAIKNLPVSAVRVVENGVPQQVRFVGQEDVPVYASLAVDGGARPEPVQAVVAALLRGLESKAPVRVARFDVPLESTPSKSQTERTDMKVLPVQPGTPMRDALLMLINGMEPGSGEIKRAVIVVGDAESYDTWRARQPVVDAANEKDVSIYAIRLEPPKAERKPGAFNRAVDALWGALIWVIDLVDDDVPSPSERQAELARLTGGTGGETCSAGDQAAAVACAQRVIRELRSQYVIAYRPTSLARAQRKIEISIEGHPNAVVRVRKASGAKGAAERTSPER